MGGKVIEELTCLLHGVFCWVSRLGGDGADGAKERGVYRAPQEEEFSADLLDEKFVGLVEARRGGFHGGILFLGSIVDGCAGEASILWTSRFGVVKLL